MRHLAHVGLFIGAILFAAITVAAQPWTHPWVSYPDNRSNWNNDAFLPNTEWSQVTRERIDEAVDQLRDTAAVEISRDRARELIGPRVSEANGVRLFLVRGVEFGQGGSVFRIYQLNGEIWVTSGILSGRDLPMHPSPVVVALAAPPARVYVSASIAQ